MSSNRDSKQTFMSIQNVNVEIRRDFSISGIQIPRIYILKYPFTKVNELKLISVKPANIGYVIGLIPFMKPRYNLLQEISINKKPNPLYQSDISKILGISKRQVSRFIKETRKAKVILKLKCNYHINPRIAQRASIFDTETLEQMIKVDPSLRKCLKTIDKQKIDIFRRAS